MWWFSFFDRIITLATNNWIGFGIAVFLVVFASVFLVWKAMQMGDEAYTVMIYFVIVVVFFLLLIMLNRGIINMPSLAIPKNISIFK
jgi:hypothetical protein